MTQTAATVRSEVGPAEAPKRFRIQDDARALWLLTASLLAAGFLVLRLLTGAAEPPPVEALLPAKKAESRPAPASDSGALHRLRPQTLDRPAVPLSIDPVRAPSPHWEHPWLEPLEGAEVEVASEPQLVR